MSCILIDNRTGSKDLVALLPSGHAQLTDLEYGDAVVVGYGPDGPVTEAFERKRLGDAMTCIQDGRFAGRQLRGLRESYEFVWLVIEDEIRADPRSGILQRRYEQRIKAVRGKRTRTEGRWVDAMFGAKKTMMYRDFMHWLLSMRRKGGIDDWAFTRNAQETADLIWTTHTWRQKKWSQHKSVDVFNTSGEGPSVCGSCGHRKGMHKSGLCSKCGAACNPTAKPLMLVQPPFVANVVKEYDGVGWDRAMAIADQRASATAHWSVEDFARATVEQLVQIDGIGKKLATSIVAQTKARRITK